MLKASGDVLDEEEKMKKLLSVLLMMLLVLGLFGCSGGNEGGETPADQPEEAAMKVALIVTGGTLGDQAHNDAMWNGVKQFGSENGVTVDSVELTEVADIETTVRTMAQDGYNLFILNSADGADMMDTLCVDLPDCKFIMYNGTNEGGYENLVNVTTDVAGAGFLTAIMGMLVNETITGEKKVGYVGGVRNPNLERVRYSMQAAADLLGGTYYPAYVGNFNDAAAAKELCQQMQSEGVHVIQAWAGGANKGVYEAAETAGEGYYSLGAATGQYHMSQTIFASLATLTDKIMYDLCTAAFKGEFKAGTFEASVLNGMVDCTLAPDSRADLVPEEIRKTVDEYRQKLISGEITAPTTEEEYNAFVAKYVNK